MNQEQALKRVKLPNGTVIEVPETATQEQVIAYAKAKSLMSEDEMKIYTESEDMLDVADFYSKVDALYDTSPTTTVIDEVFTKPLVKFAYAGFKEPKTIARALPDVGSTVGAGVAGVTAATGGLALVPTALVLGLGSAAGYFLGGEAEEAVTGVEGDVYSNLGEAKTAGLTEAGVSLLPSLGRKIGKGVKAFFTKKTALSSEFKDEAEREFAENIAERLREEDAGLLTVQAGTPSGFHSILASIARASAQGRGKIEAVLRAQADYLDKSISSIKESFGPKVSDEQLGNMYTSLVEEQKNLSNSAFESLFKGRLSQYEDEVVSSNPVVNFAKMQIGGIKKNTTYVDQLSKIDSTIKTKEEKVRRLRQEIIDSRKSLEGKELSAKMKSLREELEQTRLDVDVEKARKTDFLNQQGIGMEDAEVLSLYQEALKLQNKGDLTVSELNSFIGNLRSKITSLKSDNPAVANVVGFKGLVDMKELAEKQIKNKLSPDELKDYEVINKLYEENGDVIRGKVVASLIRKGETPTSIANLIKSSNNIDYFNSIDEITRVTKNTLLKSGASSESIAAFEKSAESIKNAVRRKYLEKNLRQYMTEDKDGFLTTGNFIEFINKEANDDVYEGVLGGTKGAEAINSLIKDYRFLTQNLPKNNTGAFSLSVLSQQSIGSREALQGASNLALGDPTGIAAFTTGLSRMLVPEALAWYITNPKEAIRLTKITEAAKKQAEKGRVSIQVMSALSSSYNRMLSSLEEEQNSVNIYEEVSQKIQNVGQEPQQ